jgi:hypothetical protein
MIWHDSDAKGLDRHEKARNARRCGLLLLAAALLGPTSGLAQENQRRRPQAAVDTVPTLGLGQGVSTFDAAAFELDLVDASQTAAGLKPKGGDGFDFTPADWLQRRDADGFFHLGDLTLRLRIGESEEWRSYSTADARKPILPLPASGPVLAAADLAPTLPSEIPLRIRRYWELEDGDLTLRFELENGTDDVVEIGALGIPMIFNNILHGRSLDEAHAVSSFHDPYIGQDAGYLQVTRLTGLGSTLVVVPSGGTPFEAYNPLLTDPTR